MPKKKKSALSKITKRARNLIGLRQNETEDETENRLQSSQQRMAAHREAETNQATLDRQRADQQRIAARREAETNQATLARQRADQQRTARDRDNETIERRVTRQQSNVTVQHVRRTLGPVQKRDEHAKKLATEMKTPKAAFRYKPHLKYNRLAYIGSMDVECNRCGALKWQMETDTMCCPKNEKWSRYPQREEVQDPRQSIYEGIGPDSNHFLNNSLKYNNLFKMTSFEAPNIPYEWSTFKVQGQVYHRVGSLMHRLDRKKNFYKYISLIIIKHR